MLRNSLGIRYLAYEKLRLSPCSQRPLWVDCVEKVGSGGGVDLAGAVTVAGGAYMAGIGSGIAIIFAILRRF
jgi:hypothetical protein